MLLSLLQEADVSVEVDRPKVPRAPYKKRVYYWTNPDTGKRSVMTWKHTFWYNNYVINTQQHDSRWANKFRKRFRLPYSSFLDLVNLCSESKMFSQWSRVGFTKYYKKYGAPLELLVLCVLCYLGCGFTVDDLYEETTISEETIRKFIHRFILYGSTTLYHCYVVKPSTSEDLADYNLEFKMAGLPGCIGSTDATHIVMERCAYRLRQLHMGYKLSHTARTYNLTVNHR